MTTKEFDYNDNDNDNNNDNKGVLVSAGDIIDNLLNKMVINMIKKIDVVM